LVDFQQLQLYNAETDYLRLLINFIGEKLLDCNSQPKFQLMQPETSVLINRRVARNVDRGGQTTPKYQHSNM